MVCDMIMIDDSDSDSDRNCRSIRTRTTRTSTRTRETYVRVVIRTSASTTYSTVKNTIIATFN